MADALDRLEYSLGLIDADLWAWAQDARSVCRELRAAREAESLWRMMLWLRHGCPISSLYRDDGEMQCPKCLIDFKRASSEQVYEVFKAINAEKMKDVEQNAE